MKTSIFLVLALCITFIYAQNDCPTQTNCKACAAEQGCGWCSATAKCIKGNKDGPDPETQEKCYGSAWLLKCPACSSFQDCRECAIFSNDCFWTNSTKCAPILLGSPKSEPCPCYEFPDCGECLYNTGCSWCPETQQCYIANETAACKQPLLLFNKKKLSSKKDDSIDSKPFIDQNLTST